LFEDFKDSFVKTFLRDDRYIVFLQGLERTVIIAVIATVIGVAVGILVGVLRAYCGRTGKLKLLNALLVAYVTVIRGTPVVVQLLIWYFVILVSTGFSAIIVAIIGFGMNSGAYVSEIIRAGIMSIDKGQTEAGRSLGLTEGMTMRFVVLPQALKNSVPPLFNEIITLLKETSIVGYITVIDLTKAGDLVRSRTYEAFFSYISVALVYLLIVLGLTWVQNRIEKKLWNK
jgi:His/Glu/Gln/Arg/opine family amino acid ABC transporter permease subunit